MNKLFQQPWRPIAAALLAAGLCCLPLGAGAGALTTASATATMLLSIEDIDNGGQLGTDLIATYFFDYNEGVNPNRTAAVSGNAIASALSVPDGASVQEELAFLFQPVDQQSQSQAEAYYANGDPSRRSTAYANLSNEGTLEIQNTSGQDYSLTIGYEALLSLIQEVTGVYSSADAYAVAELAIYDLFGQVDIVEDVSVLFGGVQQREQRVSGAFDLSVPAGGFNALTIQLNTEANAEVVPLPATLGLMVCGLVGGLVGRRKVRDRA